jgi:hypothetical protein
VGGSWAARSFSNNFETNLEPGPADTNLMRELSIPVTNLAKFKLSNLQGLDIVKDYKNYHGIVWIYSEPMKDVDDLQTFITSHNCWQIRECINQQILNCLNNLNIPIALIGGPSDVDNCDYKNISVIYTSWQKFLADLVNIKFTRGWDASYIHYKMLTYSNIRPSIQIVDALSETFENFKQLEQAGLIKGVHPTRLANELFAKEIKNSIAKWFDNL